MKRKLVGCLMVTVLMTSMLVACQPGGEEKVANGETEGTKDGNSEEQSISMVVAVTEGSTEGLEAVIANAEEELGISIDYEIPKTDADNIVKTRLASGDMADICVYNSGALLNALNPSEYFVDLSEYEFMNQLDETFKGTVTINDAVYGIPAYPSSVGAVLYNKEKYEQYELEIPKTWDQFMENCQILQEAGEDAVIGSFADAWTTQFIFLGDYYNVVAGAPDFTQEFEAGTAKFATTPSALDSFQKCSDLNPFYNEDYLATTYDNACDKMATGEGCHWIISSPVVSNISVLYDKDTANNIGVFAVPGTTESDNGITVWEPAAFYVNKDAKNMEAIMKFLEYYISDEALDAYSAVQLPNGPFCVKDYQIPEEYMTEAVKEMQVYFDEGRTQAAQEFETAVKGANCAAICQEVGTGQTTAKEAAQKYDEDCYKQAVQLGLDWK